MAGRMTGGARSGKRPTQPRSGSRGPASAPACSPEITALILEQLRSPGGLTWPQLTARMHQMMPTTSLSNWTILYGVEELLGTGQIAWADEEGTRMVCP